MAGLILPLSLLLYVGVPIWMLARGWPFRAGLVMIVTALLPWVVWLTTIQGRPGPGAGIVLILTALMLLMAFVPIGIGVAQAIARQWRPDGR